MFQKLHFSALPIYLYTCLRYMYTVGHVYDKQMTIFPILCFCKLRVEYSLHIPNASVTAARVICVIKNFVIADCKTLRCPR